MFDNLSRVISAEIQGLSKGRLFCLPYSRVLLDFFEIRGIKASPMVVRGVVFGKLNPAEQWYQLDVLGMVKTAIHGPVAQAKMETQFVSGGSTEKKRLLVPYRTIGFPHSLGTGNKTLGNYEGNEWLGHLAIVADNTLIDLTIGQLNSSEFSINFNPPYVSIETDEMFLSGGSPLIGVQDGMLVAYFPYPEERTHESSISWSEPGPREQLRTVAEKVAKIFEGRPDSELHQSPD